MNHPKTIDAISAAWLTEIRRAADVVRQPFVRAVDISPIRQGAGFLVQPGADPKERAALMRLLVDSLDAESEEGAEEAWRAEIERRIAELDSAQVHSVPGKS